MSHTVRRLERAIGGNNFSYNGECHTINGLGRDSLPVLASKLVARPGPLADYLRAQKIFWGLSPPGTWNAGLKSDMIVELQEFCLRHAHAVEEPKPIGQVQTILDELETEWNMYYASWSTNTDKKRARDEVPPATHGESSRKRARVAAAASNAIVPDHRIVESSSRNARDGPESPARDVKTEQPAEAEVQPESLSTVWRERWQDIEKFRVTDYYSRIAGRYAISCPLIEKRYPGLQGKLFLKTKLIHGDTRQQGVFAAYLDLGLFKGAVAMGIDEQTLADWCYRQQIPLHAEKSIEDQRLENEANNAHLATCGLPCIHSFEDDGHIIRAEFDTSKCAKLFMQVRLKDEKDLFMPEGAILGCKGEIQFNDLHGLEFEGKIHLPMLGPDLVKFKGYKVKQQKTDITHWATYPTTAIKYADAWNRP